MSDRIRLVDPPMFRTENFIGQTTPTKIDVCDVKELVMSNVVWEIMMWFIN
jgi:hypothetical protein